MATLFNLASSEGKPPIPKWIPPEPTKENLDWADIHTLDLGLLDSPDPKTVSSLLELTRSAIKEDGFLYLTNYGISQEQLDRQFDLAQYLHSNTTEEEKDRLLVDIRTGVYSGFKRRDGLTREEAKQDDGLEQFNFYKAEFEDPENRLPECIKPYFSEIKAFAHYLTHSVNRRLLTLLSRMLELPDDYLWDNIQSHDGPVGEGYHRHALYYPLSKEIKDSFNGMRMLGHTDHGTTTLLFSVPVTGLHIFSSKKKWQPVKYDRGKLIVNLGDALEIISGGHFKATRHKVTSAPADQEDLERLSLVQFNACLGHLKLQPAMESPLLQREGLILEQSVFRQYKALMDQGQTAPTMQEWRELCIRTFSRVPPQSQHVELREVDGVMYNVENLNGIEVLTPE